jgi:hypothetical protein
VTTGSALGCVAIASYSCTAQITKMGRPSRSCRPAANYTLPEGVQARSALVPNVNGLPSNMLEAEIQGRPRMLLHGVSNRAASGSGGYRAPNYDSQAYSNFFKAYPPGGAVHLERFLVFLRAVFLVVLVYGPNRAPS